MINTEWVRFGDLFAEPLRNGLNRPKRVRGRGIPMINMGEIFAYTRIGDIEMERVPVSDKEKPQYLLQPFDLLFARQSLVASGAGKCSIFIGTSEPTTWEGHLIRVRLNPELADPYFYFYLFSTQYGYGIIQTIVEQVAVAGIRGSDLKELQVPYVDVVIQREISKLLSTLDDKIEANRRENETLEAMARAIFKSWFVDFDPVHAKANGEAPYGMDAEMAGLFPDSFEDSELGMIPRGWKVGALDDAIEILSGGTPKTSVDAYWNGDIAWFSVKDVPTASDVFVIDTEKKITQAGVDKSATNILPLHTTIITARGTVGKLALTGVDMAMNQSCYGVRGLDYPDYFTYFHLKTLIEDLQRRTHGTVFDTITRKTFETVETVLPKPHTAIAFEKWIEPVMGKILCNLHESRTLAETRDALLPRLISGELRVVEV